MIKPNAQKPAPARMMNRGSGVSGTRPVRLAYVPMIDCAPIIMARELGLFDKYGVDVRLSREVGWATVREKILHREVDAAHAHASMAVAIHCGMGVPSQPCLTGLCLNLNGNAITLSNELWELGVRDARTLKIVIDRFRGQRTLVFAAVLEHSAQQVVLRKWLTDGGINPAEDVSMVILPSPLVHENLLKNHIDGYCVGEPWSSVLLVDGHAWCPATSAEVLPDHPEKVLLVLEEFAQGRPEAHLALLAALIEAAEYCQQSENRAHLVRVLARPEYLDLPARILENSLLGDFMAGRGRTVTREIIRYHGGQANVPSREKARWVYDSIREVLPPAAHPGLRREVLGKIFRSDLYDQALERVHQQRRHEKKGPPLDELASSFLPTNFQQTFGQPRSKVERLSVSSN